jgi:hypothetical protein
MVTREALEYLEVNLHTMHVVVAVQTQGRFGNGMGQEYAEVYMLDYWRPGFNSNMWARWKDRSGKQVSSGLIYYEPEEERVFVFLVWVLNPVPRFVYNFCTIYQEFILRSILTLARKNMSLLQSFGHVFIDIDMHLNPNINHLECIKRHTFI